MKGNKMSVGRGAGVEQSFTEQTIALKKNDLLFMFTDGYTDQFGGSRGKKLMIKRFRELMLKMSHLPLREMHEQIAGHFDEWKGEHEQTDDVLVFAMRVN
jgi:serine phosphatase RsbU (regulator of sigma subunit)